MVQSPEAAEGGIVAESNDSKEPSIVMYDVQGAFENSAMFAIKLRIFADKQGRMDELSPVEDGRTRKASIGLIADALDAEDVQLNNMMTEELHKNSNRVVEKEYLLNLLEGVSSDFSRGSQISR